MAWIFSQFSSSFSLVNVGLQIAMGVLLGISVYSCARANGDRNAVLWGVLSGVFSVVGITYLLVKLTLRTGMNTCRGCGHPIEKDSPVCPHCGFPAVPTHDYVHPAAKAVYQKRSLCLLVIWTVLYVLQQVIVLVYSIQLLTLVTTSAIKLT